MPSPFARSNRIVLSSAVLLGTVLQPLGPAPALAAAPAVKLSPKDNALYIMRSGLKSADFLARGMAYRGVVMDKSNKDLKQILEDGATDPQWPVRKGVAEAMYAVKNAGWKKIVHDALALPVLSAYESLPVLDEIPQKDAFAVLIETLADKEHSQQDVIFRALVGRNRPDLPAFFVTALASKDALVQASAKKALANVDLILHSKTLEAVAKAQGGNDEVAKILADLAALSDERMPAGWLTALKPKDQALARRVVLIRAAHGDKTVGKSLLQIAKATTGAEQTQALQAYKKVADKGDVAALKELLAGANPELIFQVYEILARMGDRSMAKEAQDLASSTDVDVRAPGVFYLGWVGGAGRLREMHQYLTDGVPSVRIAAARVLGNIGSPVSVEPLRDALDNEHDDRVRVEFVRALTGIRAKEGYQALMMYTREKEPDLRRVVVKALADSGDPAVRAGLQNALNDSDPRIRFEAVRGFLISDPAKAVDVWKRAIRWLPRGALLELTRELNKTMGSFLEIAVFSAGSDEQGVTVREEAMLALHNLPETELAVLHKVLNTSDDQDLRVRVLTQLFELEKGKVATEIKTAALGQQVRARIPAIRLLGKIKGDKEAQEILTKLLDEPDERVRIAAALTFLGG